MSEPTAPPPAPGSKCAAVTKAGRPCPWPPGAGSPFCSNHDPAQVDVRRAELAAAGRRGGEARARTLADLGPGGRLLLRRLRQVEQRFENQAQFKR